LSADAAPFLRRLSESLNGEVPIVVPAVFERTFEFTCQRLNGSLLPLDTLPCEMSRILASS
jgi:hypothetical protein